MEERGWGRWGHEGEWKGEGEGDGRGRRVGGEKVREREEGEREGR